MKPRRNQRVYGFIVAYMHGCEKVTARELYEQFNATSKHGTTIREVTQVISRHRGEIVEVGYEMMPRGYGGSSRHILYALRVTATA